MAVVEYQELSRSGSIDESGYRTYRREFLVRTDNPLDGPRPVAAGVPIPFYSAYDCGDGEAAAKAGAEKAWKLGRAYVLAMNQTTKKV